MITFMFLIALRLLSTFLYPQQLMQIQTDRLLYCWIILNCYVEQEYYYVFFPFNNCCFLIFLVAAAPETVPD